MSVNNFIPQMWAGGILAYNMKRLVYGEIANTDYEGEIKAAGDSVKISMLLPPSVSAYTKNSTTLTYPELDDDSRILFINQSNSVSFAIDDVDKAQQTPKLMDAAISLSSYSLKNTADAFFLGLYGDAGSTITDADLDTATITSKIVLAGQYLDEADVPDDPGQRFLVIPPWVYAKMVLAKVLKGTDNVEIMNNGYVGKFMGFDVYKSNNIYTTGTAPSYTSHCLAGWKKQSIAFAEQLLNVEALRHPTRFGDAVRALHVFGGKVVRPDCLIDLTLTYAAETTI